MYKINKISESDKKKFIGQIIDMFEDFLTEKKAFMNGKVASPDEAVIYGNDYDKLESHLNHMMKLWNVFDKGDKA